VGTDPELDAEPGEGLNTVAASVAGKVE